MLIHIAPRIFLTGKWPYPSPVSLERISIFPFGIVLKGGEDVTCRRPYPNKRYSVACRKTGRKAINGILIRTAEPVSSYAVQTFWNISDAPLPIHQVTYNVTDNEFDAVTDSSCLWGRFESDSVCYEPRTISRLSQGAPVAIEPYLKVNAPQKPSAAHGEAEHRHHHFRQPTIEPGRLTASVFESERFHPPGDAFEVAP